MAQIASVIYVLRIIIWLDVYGVVMGWPLKMRLLGGNDSGNGVWM